MIIQQSQKDELIKRAVEHREADRLIQSYGYFEQMDDSQADHYNMPGMNGEKTDWQAGDWAGCAIGCLATPVLSQEELRKQWDDYLNDQFSADCPVRTYDDSIRILERDFGIEPILTRMCETVFEGLPKEEATLWPEQLVRALPVGVPFGIRDALGAGNDSVWSPDGELYWTGRGFRADMVREARNEILAFLEKVGASIAA